MKKSANSAESIPEIFVKRNDVGKSALTVNYTLPMPPLNKDKKTVGVIDFMRNGLPPLIGPLFKLVF